MMTGSNINGINAEEIVVSLSSLEVSVIIKGVTAIPLAMIDPLHPAAMSVFDKLKTAAQKKLNEVKETDYAKT